MPSCRAAGAGPPPWNSANLVVQACSTRNKLVTRLLKVKTVTFLSDSSRKWHSVWLVGENLDRSCQVALSCRWMLGSVSEHHSHSNATTPRFRFAHLVEIEESATGPATLPIDFSPLSWWDKTYMLQIVLIYHGMKLMNTLCLSHLICFWCLAMKASPMSDTKIVTNLLHAVWIRVVLHDFPCTITWFWLSRPSRFWVQRSFLTYLFFPTA